MAAAVAIPASTTTMTPTLSASSTPTFKKAGWSRARWRAVLGHSGDVHVGTHCSPQGEWKRPVVIGLWAPAERRRQPVRASR
jgi:hypothetical protein